MEYVKLGNSDIEVSRLCAGCMSFGDPASNFHAWTLDESTSTQLVKKALDTGINFFDTANIYSAGTSEEYLGRAVRQLVPRNQVVLASKVYFNEGKLSRAAIHRESYFEDAAGALRICLSAEDVAWLEELYQPHRVVGAL